MTVNLPILVYGTITENGVNVNAITVKVRNESTNEVGAATTNSSGVYLIDLSNKNLFASGYTVGDQITIYTIYSNFEGQDTFTITSNVRSEEHTSELQSHSFISYAVFCLKKKKNNTLIYEPN